MNVDYIEGVAYRRLAETPAQPVHRGQTGRVRYRAAAHAEPLPAVDGLLSAQDRPRAADPDGRRRRSKELHGRGPGRAAARSGPPLQHARDPDEPGAADQPRHRLLHGEPGTVLRPGPPESAVSGRGFLHLGGHLQPDDHRPGLVLRQRHLRQRPGQAALPAGGRGQHQRCGLRLVAGGTPHTTSGSDPSRSCSSRRRCSAAVC